MQKSVIWKMDPPEITLEDLFMAQGADYRTRTPRSNVLELNRRILEETSRLARPIAIWNAVNVTGGGEQELILEQGMKLKSKLLAKVAGSADKLILLAMTIGSDLDDRLAAYSKAGQALEAFVLDAAGSAFLTKSAPLAFGMIKEKYQSEGMTATFPLGPGHSYWKGLDDVKTIIDFLHAEQIGITLTESNLMRPQKSLAFVMGVGKNLPDFKGKIHCDFCTLKKDCNMHKLGEKCV
ncbi:MAG: Vitamin B12 dependent methionine synthase activation subunit [Dehalobacterium sp.]